VKIPEEAPLFREIDVLAHRDDEAHRTEVFQASSF
jgi:hypothetical protein